MENILIVATTSYAGMGPYVTGIVNTFEISDNVYFFFHDYEDQFFRKNVKKELLPHCYFHTESNSNWHKLKSLCTDKLPEENKILEVCRDKQIGLVHFINGPVPTNNAKKFSSMGIRLLGTVHDLHPHEAKKAFHKMLRQRILSKRTLKAIIAGDNLATNSPSQLQELKQLYPQKRLFFYDFPSLASPEVVEGHEIPAGLEGETAPYILFFGRIEEYKGIGLLYKAFLGDKNLCDKYKLVIAGSGTLPFERPAEERNVVLINRYIKDTEVRYLYEHAACVVYPYISATQSGVLSVAYYFRTPVIASDVPFFKGIIEPSGAGVLFKTGDVKDLQSKLKMLLSTDASDVVQQETAYYQEHYDNAALRGQLLKIYQDILK